MRGAFMTGIWIKVIFQAPSEQLYLMAIIYRYSYVIYFEALSQGSIIVPYHTRALQPVILDNHAGEMRKQCLVRHKRDYIYADISIHPPARHYMNACTYMHMWVKPNQNITW